MRKLDVLELKRIDVERFRKASKIPVVVVLDNIRSGLNVGSIFRTADAFRLEKIVLCGITARPPHKEIFKTSIGATNSVDWVYEENVVSAVQTLRRERYEIIGIEQTDKSIPLPTLSRSPEERFALIFGNEVGGLSDAILPLLDLAVEVPQFGTKHSLNVSVCAGIVLWQVFHPPAE